MTDDGTPGQITHDLAHMRHVYDLDNLPGAVSDGNGGRKCPNRKCRARAWDHTEVLVEHIRNDGRTAMVPRCNQCGAYFVIPF